MNNNARDSISAVPKSSSAKTHRVFSIENPTSNTFNTTEYKFYENSPVSFCLMIHYSFNKFQKFFL